MAVVAVQVFFGVVELGGWHGDTKAGFAKIGVDFLLLSFFWDISESIILSLATLAGA